MIYSFINKYLDNALASSEQALAVIESRIKTAPPGSLSIKKPKGKAAYYHSVYDGGKMSQIYLGRDKIELARKLAQKSYDMEILDCLKNEIEAIKALKNFKPEEKYRKYSELTEERKELVKPFGMYSDKDVEAWKEKYSKRNTFKTDELLYLTKKGERRRSKSERDISDVLDSYSDVIEYVYEPLIKLRKSKKNFCPDFLILNKLTGEVFYWEHFGGFGLDDYTSDFVLKMQVYNGEGPEFTSRLITTFETSDHPLQPQMIQDAVKQILSL